MPIQHRTAIIALVTILVIGGVWIAVSGDAPAEDNTDTSPEEDTATEIPAWMRVQLEAVQDEISFTLEELEKPVLLESFAVWCTTCLAQQRQIKDLHETTDTHVTSVTINTDPNEGRQKVIDHVTRHNFTWTYTVAPAEMIQELRNEFGPSILVAPRAPMVLICDGNTYRRLQDGVKSTDTLASEIEQGC